MADTPLASGSNIIHIIWAKKSKILSEDFLKNGGSAKDQTKKKSAIRQQRVWERG
jgi:hypothetical protein